MSTQTRTGRSNPVSLALESPLEWASTISVFRWLAYSGLGVLTVSYLAVLQEITITVGGTRSLSVLVIAMFVGAVVFAHTIHPRTALAVALGAGALGFWYYFEVTGYGIGVIFSEFDTLISDTVTLATGMSIQQMAEAGTWTLGFAPAPVFLSWYLAVRRRYALAVVPGGAALLFLVLTTDATIGVTLVGVVGGIATVGFGELDRRDGSIAQADVLAILFAVIVFLSMTVTLVPGGAASPTVLVDDDADTLDGTIDSNPDETGISGSVDLSPEVHFTVVSDEPSYWRTAVYDRYTGDSWLRTGPEGEYDEGVLEAPPGQTQTMNQTITIESQQNVLPTAAQPTAIGGDITADLEVTDHGQPMPEGTLIEGDTYNVESAVLDADPAELNDAGTDYGEDVEEYYLQTPEDMSGAFEDRTAEIVEEAGAETPYEKAAAIEQYFNAEYDYSLEVDRPDGNVANDFLLEMDEGYCVYFATAMTQMLRAEEVPARYVTGYTSGQQVDDHEHVVRGLDAHAWVEVYFPDHGWVAFEPTPSSERDDTHDDRLEEAREDGEDGIDTEESEDVPVDGEDEDAPDFLEEEDPDALLDGPHNESDPDLEDNESTDNETQAGEEHAGQEGLLEGENDTDGSEGEVDDSELETDDEGLSLPVSPGDLLVGTALFLGLAAGAHRSGVTGLVGREARLYWQGFDTDPDTDTQRAYERLEHLLARQYRSRRRGESPRQYLESISKYGSVDPRVRRVTALYEQATYGGGLDRDEADEAVSLVTGLARERVPLLGRFWR